MKLIVTRRARALLFFLSARAYTAWFSGLGERSDAAAIATNGLLNPASPRFSRAPEIGISILRDPFDGGPSHAATAAAKSLDPAPVAADGGVPQRIADSANGVIVPDIRDASGTGARATLVVRATIVGRNPIAYVENGATMDIVRVGDTLGNERVASIDLSGLTFVDGSRIDLPGATASTPRPAARPATVEQRLDEIRKLLVHLNAPLPQPVTTPTASTPPSPSARFPSPRRSRPSTAAALPSASIPTSDPNAPTPYPDPYPYAPAR